jgi:hypothetical protein
MATAQTHSVDVNALPHIENISLPIGDAYRKLWTLQRDTGTAAAVSLTSVTWTLIVSDKRGGTELLSKTTTSDWTASGVHIDTAASGQFSVYLIGSDVTTIGVRSGAYYEVVATFPSGHADFPSMVKTLIAGSLTVREDT